MTSTTPPTLPPPPAREEAERTPGRSVPLKYVLIGLGALIVLSVTFYAGMAYENHRIKSAVEDAFSGFGTESEESSEGDEEAESTPEPVELVEGSPVETNTYEGTVTVTLISTSASDEAAADEVLTRNLAYEVKIENTGSTPVTPSFSGHYETDAGEVLEFAGVFCDEDSLPSDELDPGQFVQGCESSDLPDESGRLVFDGFTPELYIVVPAAA
jgi:hypothetical protein